MRSIWVFFIVVCCLGVTPAFSEKNSNPSDANAPLPGSYFLRFNGHVLGPDGKPVAGATVRPYRDPQAQAVTSDSDGVFEIPFPFPDGFQKTFLLEASKNGNPPLCGMLSFYCRGEDYLTGDIAMAPAGTIRGIVTDKTSKPIPSANVSVSVGDVPIRSVGCDAAGQFVISNLAGNMAYDLVITAAQYAPGRCQAVHVTAGATQDVGTRALYLPDKSIEGTVIDEAGKPIFEASVSCEKEAGESQQVKSDAYGHFRFEKLTEGYYRVRGFFKDQMGREQVSTISGPIAHIDLHLKAMPRKTAPEKASLPVAVDPANAQILHFPADFAVGMIGFEGPNRSGSIAYFDGKEAKGNVAIPKGKHWGLLLGPLVRDNPARLDSVPPEEMEAVTIEYWDPQEVNRAVKHLSRFSQLQGLELKKIDPDQVDFSPLSNLSHLTDLSIVHEVLINPEFKTIGCLKSVQRLSLSGKSLSKTSFNALTAFKGLQALSLDVHSMDNSGLAALTPMNIERINLSGIQTMSVEGYAHLARIPSLKALSLGNLDVMPNQLAELAKSSHLEQLTITRVVTEHLIALKPLQSLRIVRLYTNMNDTRHYFSEPGFAALAELKNLETLYIEACGPTSDASLQSLVSLSKLKVLSIMNREEVTDAQMACFAQMSALEELGIRGSQITDEGLAKLSGLKSLKKVCLFPDSKVTPSGIARLQKTIPGLVVTNGIGLDQ